MKRTVLVALLLALALGLARAYGQNMSGPTEDDRAVIKEIQQAIEARGAKWTAGTNDIFLLSDEEKRRMLGVRDTISLAQIPPSEQVMRYAWHPDKFDWRSVDGANWMTPVKNQGACGSCVAFAVIGTLEGQLDIFNNNPSLNMNLSEQHIFACGGGTCDGGWQVPDGFAYLLDNGAPGEGCFPYASGADGLDRPCPGTCPNWRDQAVRISCWGWASGANNVSTPAEIKDRLLKGPVATSMTVYADFDAYARGIYEHVWGEERGGHAVVFVGWDDTTDPPCWIVRNSWGVWGEAGHFRIVQGKNDCGIESQCLYLMLGDVAEGNLSDNGHLFGNTDVGDSEDWSLGINNIGADDLEIYGFSQDSLSPFSIVAPTPYPQTIAPGETLLYSVTFSPQAAGFQHTRMTVNSNSCVLFPELKFRGTGVVHAVRTEPKSVGQTIDQEDRVAVPFRILNTGGVPLGYRLEVLKSWLSVAPDSGIIPAGDAASCSARLDASTLAPGWYRTNILIRTDDTTDKVVVLPVSLQVMEAAGVAVNIPATVVPIDQAPRLDLCVDNLSRLEVPLGRVSLQIEFDPTLLGIEGIEPAPRIASMSEFGWQEIQPGLISLSIADSEGGWIAPGTGPLARMSFVFHSQVNCGDSLSVAVRDVAMNDTLGTGLDVRISSGPLVALCRGDVDVSGAINVLDVMKVVRSIVQRSCSDMGQAPCWAADYNGDEVVDARDVVGMIHHILQ